MKVAYCSDLHLEFYNKLADFGLPKEMLSNSGRADVLVLAGDIIDTVCAKRRKFAALMAKLALAYPRILVVMGNHEHYGGDFSATAGMLRTVFDPLPNVRLLDKEGVTFDGVRFFGGTKWTDLSGGDALVTLRVWRAMNDYRSIKDSTQQDTFRVQHADGSVEFHSRYDGLLSTETTMRDQQQYLSALNADLKAHPELPFFVISHHTPSYKLCASEHVNNSVNAAYHDSLENYIIDHPQIKKWVCGHTHVCTTMHLEQCELLLNARGYYMERLSKEFELKYTSI